MKKNKKTFSEVIEELSAACGSKQRLADLMGVERTTLFNMAKNNTASMRSIRSMHKVALYLDVKFDIAWFI